MTARTAHRLLAIAGLAVVGFAAGLFYDRAAFFLPGVTLKKLRHLSRTATRTAPDATPGVAHPPKENS